MNKKRTVKLLSILILAFIVFQLVPSILVPAEDFQSHTQNCKVFLSAASFNSDVLYLGKEDHKSSIQKVQIKNTQIYIPQIFIKDINSTNFTFWKMPFDYRSVIRQSIPHYFNGGKYKGNHFAI